MRVQRLLVIGLLAVGVLLSAQWATQTQAQEPSEMPLEMRNLIHDVREATTIYHDLEAALEGGYGKFLDCFTLGEDMGMGQHYVHGDLVSDDILDPAQPEALVYEPMADGSMTLVAFEYLVFADVWDPDNEGREPPTLYGQEFHLKTNIPETPPVWALHIWLWTHNPEGLFADYNPFVFCPADQAVVDMAES